MKFKLLQGNFVTGERGNRKTYKPGDVIESEKDLSKIKGKFERVDEIVTTKRNPVETAETAETSQDNININQDVKVVSKAKRTKKDV